ncbi:MAG: hemerythrin domain-containing protein [Ignavibacteria bacterium]
MKRFEQIHYLSWDHQSTLMEAFKIQKYIDSLSNEELIQKREKTIQHYENDLLLHFRTEEECLLPRMILKQNVNSDLIRKTLDDHILIHSLFLLLKKEKSDIQKIKSILKEISKALNDHIRFEERELFEHSQSLLKAEDFNEIQQEIFKRYGDKYKSSSCQLPEF